MKVILLKDIKKLGNIGDEINVKDGYARNFLIPQRSAILSTNGALRIIEQKKREQARKERKIKEECEQLAAKLESTSCTISMEAGEEEKLFGSVTAEMIAESLNAEGLEIDKRKIVIEEPIKTLGVYNVKILVHPEVKTQIRIWVVKK
ncbi:MAG: 50S ribosomal protein L9 [Candidatus Omnitrophota bacterium]